VTCLGSHALSAEVLYRVIKVTDGDTIKVQGADEKILNIRLAEVDAPETKQPFGIVAKAYLTDKLKDKDVTLQVVTKDRYGRVVAWIMVDNTCINDVLIMEGYAWWYEAYGEDLTLAELQRYAQRNKLGLWNVEKMPIAPWDWRKGKRDASN
jgi:micrococcal nuclease